MKANSGKDMERLGKISKTVMAAVPAPADTPIVPGSAKGLRITAWSRAPAEERAAPTRIASTTRGKRKFVTTTRIVFSSFERVCPVTAAYSVCTIESKE